jgi:ADP-ribose pyrophosphatase YjhB (NUDIX family)
VELGESSVEAVVREIREELEAELLDPRLLGVLENIFELDGELGHEICFIYLGELADPSTIPPEGRSFIDVENPGWVEWRPLRDPDPDVALFPDGLQELVERAMATGA